MQVEVSNLKTLSLAYLNLTKYSRFSQFMKIKEILELAISQGGAKIEYVIVLFFF